MRSAVLLAAYFSTCLFAGQRYVDPLNTYHRVYAIVPVSGSRPLYAPDSDEIGPKTGIVGFSSMLSDDGSYALIEIVARDRSTLLPILNDKSIQAFEKGAVRPAVVEAAFQKHRPSFRFALFDEVAAR